MSLSLTRADTCTHWQRPWCWGRWRQEEKGTAEDERVGWHHRLDAPEFEQAPGVSDGQGSLACCSLLGHKESDTTERLDWTDTCTYPTGLLLGFEWARSPQMSTSLTVRAVSVFDVLSVLFTVCLPPVRTTTLGNRHCVLLTTVSRMPESVYQEIFIAVEAWLSTAAICTDSWDYQKKGGQLFSVKVSFLHISINNL